MQCGEYLGAYATYGYQKSREDSHRLVIDEEAAQWVRNIFTWYAAGYSIQSILTILEKEKVSLLFIHWGWQRLLQMWLPTFSWRL